MNISAQFQPSFKQAIRFGWENSKTNILFFIGVFFIIMGSSLILNIIDRAIGILFISMALSLASSLINSVFNFALCRVILDSVDSKKPNFKQFMHFTSDKSGLLIKYIFASFLSTLIIGIGFILLIIPGIIWSIKYQFVGYTVIDKNLNPFEALKSSADLTKGIFWKLSGFISLMFLINVVGFLCLGIGLLLTIPTTMVAHAYLYRSLVSQSEVVVVT